MTLFAIATKNLARRPARSLLTLLGIAIGIGAVVALVGMAWGFEHGWVKTFDARGAQVIIKNASSVLPQPIDEEITEMVRAQPEIADAQKMLVQVVSVEEQPLVSVSGREWGGFLWEQVEVVKGRLPGGPEADEVVLGTVAKEILEKEVGDEVFIETGIFKVVGIVDAGATLDNASILIELSKLQELTLNEGLINVLNVRVRDDRILRDEPRWQELVERIESEAPDVTVFRPEEVMANNSGVQTAKALSLSMSVLAILVGLLGVMNTMLMSVFERTSEIGILLAIGWKKLRIMGMIILESILLSAFGGVAGVLLGVAAIKAVQQLPAAKGRIDPLLNAELILGALMLAMVVGLLSGILPAWRSAKMNPSDAIRA